MTDRHSTIPTLDATRSGGSGWLIEWTRSRGPVAVGERAAAEQVQETEESIFEDITEQLERTGRLLTGDLNAAAEIAFEDIVDNIKVAERITAGLTDLTPLALPDQFAAAHRRCMGITKGPRPDASMQYAEDG